MLPKMHSTMIWVVCLGVARPLQVWGRYLDMQLVRQALRFSGSYLHLPISICQVGGVRLQRLRMCRHGSHNLLLHLHKNITHQKFKKKLLIQYLVSEV